MAMAVLVPNQTIRFDGCLKYKLCVVVLLTLLYILLVLITFHDLIVGVE